MSRRSVLGLLLAASAGVLPPATAEAAVAGLRFEIYKDSRKKFRWRLRAGNNKVIASGEGYQAKADCRNAIELIIRDAGSATIDDQTVG